jgi:hypothetical protein
MRGLPPEECEEPLGLVRAALVEKELDADACVDGESFRKPHRR